MASAVAPPGGCRHFVRCMAKIASDTAHAAAMNSLGMSLKHVIPITAAIRWLPTNDHGCAIGLCSAANSKTEEAPIEATINGTALCPRLELRMPVSKMPRNADMAETTFSAKLTGAET